MKRKILLTASAVILLGPLGQAWAQEAAPVVGDAAAGKVTAAACAECHGMDGISPKAGVPHLGGQHASYVEAGLAAYKSGERTDEDMQKAAAPLSEQDIADLAAYYSGLEAFNERPAPPGGEATLPAEPDPFAEIKQKTAACAGCHGADGNAMIPGMPSLAGQQVAYFITAMKAYQDKTRADATMQALAAPLSRSDIEDMAYFYAASVPRQTTNLGKGDAFAGVSLAAGCANCHGEDGNSRDPKNPRLAGLDADYLVVATTAYKDGSREHDVMAEAVSTLRDEDIQDLSAFYASKEPEAPPIRKPLTIAEWTARCNRCHGPGGNSSDDRFPIIAGQDEAYLVEALEHYHGGERQNPMMFAMSFLMAESDINKLAAYYARQRAE